MTLLKVFLRNIVVVTILTIAVFVGVGIMVCSGVWILKLLLDEHRYLLGSVMTFLWIGIPLAIAYTLLEEKI